jgi:hypothetical protein
MRCGGWRISDLLAAEMKNPLMKISGFFFCLKMIVPTLCVGMHPVTLCVTF